MITCSIPKLTLNLALCKMIKSFNKRSIHVTMFKATVLDYLTNKNVSNYENNLRTGQFAQIFNRKFGVVI